MQMPIGGSINSMIRNMKMEMKWDQRKANPMMPKGNEEDPQITELKRQAAEVRKGNAIANLDAKVKSGCELTNEELEYLRTNSPELYRQVMEVKREREEYKKELERCKTKEDVERLKARKLNMFVTEARAISSNANIPLDKKLEKIEQIGRRMMGIQSEHVKFVQKPEYQQLPTEKEIEEGKKKKKQTQKAEVEIPTEKPLENVYTFEEATDLLEQAINDIINQIEQGKTPNPKGEKPSKSEPATPTGSGEAEAPADYGAVKTTPAQPGKVSVKA